MLPWLFWCGCWDYYSNYNIKSFLLGENGKACVHINLLLTIDDHKHDGFNR